MYMKICTWRSVHDTVLCRYSSREVLFFPIPAYQPYPVLAPSAADMAGILALPDIHIGIVLYCIQSSVKSTSARDSGAHQRTLYTPQQQYAQRTTGSQQWMQCLLKRARPHGEFIVPTAETGIPQSSQGCYQPWYGL